MIDSEGSAHNVLTIARRYVNKRVAEIKMLNSLAPKGNLVPLNIF